MRKAIDITGQRFGRLVAIRPTEERKGRYVYWECLCDCGVVKSVRSASLHEGHTRSCGCLQLEAVKVAGAKRKKDLKDNVFGRLVAIKPTKKRMVESIVWLCECVCGNLAFVPSGRLVSGNTKSCGCLQKEGGKKRRLLHDEAYILYPKIGKRNAVYLTDAYVKQLLTQRGGLDNNQITPELIELKRELLQMGRLERRLNGLISTRNQGIKDNAETI